MANLKAKVEIDKITVEFSGFSDSREFFKMVEFIKGLPGRHFDVKNKRWEVPYSSKAATLLKEKGFPISEVKEERQEEKKKIVIKEIPGLTRELYSYQMEGVQFLESREGRGLIADEMGCGKTIQAIAYLQLHPELRPAIIVCPASAKYVWENEIKTHTTATNVQSLSGRKGDTIKDANIVIINYDILKSRLINLREMKPKIIILDESHACKSPTTQRTKAVKELCDKIPHVICLSGTPITNRPIEFFTTLNLLDPYLFPNRFKFGLTYCNAKSTRFGWDMTGASNTDLLHRILTKTIMIRRKKSEVLKDLPPKTRASIPLDIDNKKEYREIEKDVLKWIYENEGLKAAAKASKAEYVVQIEKLKQAAARGKLQSVKEWIQDFIDTGEKLVMFCSHTAIIDALHEHFKDISVKLDGSTKQLDRAEIVNKFQGDKNCMIFFGNLIAAGQAITLTAASNVAFMEYDWVPGRHLQAEDRVHRIGQTADNITVHYLIAKDTIEETIVTTLERKSKTLNEILDGNKKDEDGAFNEVLKQFIEKKGE